MFGSPLTEMFLLEITMGQYSALSLTKHYRIFCLVSKKVLSFETNPNVEVRLNSFAKLNVWGLVPNFNVLVRNNNGSKLCPVFHETLSLSGQ